MSPKKWSQRMHNFLLFSLFAIFSLNSHALDINKACQEFREQKEALLSYLSTSLTEANMAGQCIGYRAVIEKTELSIDEACVEYIEQRESLLGNFSTSLKEANKAGQCLGAIYAACGLGDFNHSAEKIVSHGSIKANSPSLKRIADCRG
jgi:hypothetical protein